MSWMDGLMLQLNVILWNIILVVFVLFLDVLEIYHYLSKRNRDFMRATYTYSKKAVFFKNAMF